MAAEQASGALRTASPNPSAVGLSHPLTTPTVEIS